ncbi:uncharacterized protein L201_007705 [Kwoniella dendrophila CBS 6074]|uniref:Required for respiratory growth protein 7, mitochondrial n=1 Tax=Kwoniella dendrophila CBS 6074 TaxID=1295534 RepID=A0AAX4K4U7_9TREE
MAILTKLKRRRTTLDIGTSFEKHVSDYLNNELYMNLRRIGGANDGGIDLKGWWWLPKPKYKFGPQSQSQIQIQSQNRSSDIENLKRIRVIVQCKAEKKSLGPRAIRELEGVMNNLNYRNNRLLTSSTESLSFELSQDKNLLQEEEERLNIKDSIGILCSQSGFTKQTMLYSTSSNIPLMLIHLPGGKLEIDDNDDLDVNMPNSDNTDNDKNIPGIDQKKRKEVQVESLWWNKSLSEGILGNSIELRKTIKSNGISVGLWMNGQKVGKCGPKV